MNKGLRQRLRSVIAETPADSFARRVATAKPISLHAGLAEGKSTPASKALGRLVNMADAATKALPMSGVITTLGDAVVDAVGDKIVGVEATRPFISKLKEAERTLEQAKQSVTLFWKQVNELTAMWSDLPASVTGREPPAKTSHGKPYKTPGFNYIPEKPEYFR